MTRGMRVWAWLIAAGSVALFVWSLRHVPCWTPGCVSGAVLAGAALGLMWTPDYHRGEFRSDYQPRCARCGLEFPIRPGWHWCDVEKVNSDGE